MSEVKAETPKKPGKAVAAAGPKPLALSVDPMMMIASSLSAMQQQTGPITEGQLALLDKVMAFRNYYAAEAKKDAFVAAMVLVKADLGPIIKNKHVKFAPKDPKPGDKEVDYWHEDLSAVCEVVDAAAPQHGITYRWDTITELNKPLVVRCIVSGHGYEVVVEQSGPRDGSGRKNEHQGQTSGLTYLKRDTLKSAFGLAAKDDDARASGDPTPPAPEPTIGAAEIGELQKLIDDTDTKTFKVMGAYKVEHLGDMTFPQYKDARGWLEEKKRRIDAAKPAQPDQEATQ